MKNNYKDVTGTITAEEGIKLFKKNKPDIVLLDLRLPGMDGIACFKELKKINPLVKVIFITIVTRKESIEEAKALGAKDYIIKPITEEKLMKAIGSALK